jgi:uncharacterized membrane protein
MGKGRLEAFSDGVLAIIITIMVLELKVPEEPTWAALVHVAPTFLSYVLSFVYVGIYWNNHHHTLTLATRVDGAVLWANLHLLFWLSLIPFSTRWVDDSHFAEVPVAVYGVNLLLAAIAYVILARALIRLQGPDGPLTVAMGGDWKGKFSPVIYLVAVAVSFVEPWLALAAYAVVAAIWVVPDRRVERYLAAHDSD